jgi:hypothetical protein
MFTDVVSGLGSFEGEDGEIVIAPSWSTTLFFVWHSSCCLEVRRWRTSCHKVTSCNFLLILCDFNGFFIVKQSHTTEQKDIYFLSTLYKRYGARYKVADDITITVKVFK